MKIGFILAETLKWDEAFELWAQDQLAGNAE